MISSCRFPRSRHENKSLQGNKEPEQTGQPKQTFIAGAQNSCTKRARCNRFLHTQKIKPIETLSHVEQARISRKAIEKEVLAWVLGGEKKITSIAQADYLIRFYVKNDHHEVLSAVPKHLLAELVTADLVQKCRIHLPHIPRDLITEEIALASITHHASSYNSLPDRLKSKAFFYKCLELNPLVLEYLTDSVPEDEWGEIDFAAYIGRHCEVFLHIPKTCMTEELRRLAVTKHPEAVSSFDNSTPGYEALCLIALQIDGRVIKKIPKANITRIMAQTALQSSRCAAFIEIPSDLITSDDCLQAIEAGKIHRLLSYITWRDSEGKLKEFQKLLIMNQDLMVAFKNCRKSFPCFLEVLPENEVTEEICRQHLNNYPTELEGVPERWLIKHPEWCMVALKHDGGKYWQIPGVLKDLDFIKEAITCNPSVINSLPYDFHESHPELLEFALTRGIGFMSLPYRERTKERCLTAVKNNPQLITRRIPEGHVHAMPLESQAAFCFKSLPESAKRQLVVTGEVSSLERYQPLFNPNELLQPMNPLETNEYSPLLGKLACQLAVSQPFQFPNESIGLQLQNYLYHHIKTARENISKGQVLAFSGPQGGWQPYGGRTFLCDEGLSDMQPGRCRRIKILREGEDLNEFITEEAVHSFCADNSLSLNLRSEVPKVVGLRRLPVESLPAEMKEQCKSKLATLMIGGQPCYLLYVFETKNREYSQLAHQRDSENGCEKAECGILKTCFDLGRWSGCGVVHTSTIQAFHNFSRNRRELFLAPLFSELHEFPGVLSFWDTDATDQCDWGWTGLRDLGDIEFSPFIDSYRTSSDAYFSLPGYYQRAAFLNAFVENMVAALLINARLHKSDSGYHYRNADCVSTTAAFVVKCIDHYLQGFSGEGSTLKSFFRKTFSEDADKIYEQWRERAAREIVYWTAPQELDKDCYVCHISQRGRLPEEILPDAPVTFSNYPECFAKNGKYHLGITSSPFPLNTLIRGLAFAASHIAEFLQPDEPIDQSK